MYVGEGKSGDVLTAFWKRLKRSKVELEVIATDMGSAFIKSARGTQPQAVNIADHFYVINLYNEKLTKLRRDVQLDAECAYQRGVVKGIRWLLLMSNGKLREKDEDAQDRLKKALVVDEPLAKPYYLKEELGMVWKQQNKMFADAELTEWIRRADASGVTLLKSFSRSLARLCVAILAYYDLGGLSSGPMEGANNKIKTIHKTAYGFRDLEFFKLKLKILSMHETRKDAFAG